MATKSQLQIDGLTVAVSNLEKIFYPQTGFTKGQVIDYYINVAPALLPHLRHRPVSLKRYPDGVDGFFFYEKQCPPHRPEWVKTSAAVRKDGSEINYCLTEDLPSLIWAVNLADLEVHTFLHCAPAIEIPTVLAFDLDPGPPAHVVQCCQVALWLREMFARLHLECFPKTSGSKGLQVSFR